jgi:hypothetical protein
MKYVLFLLIGVSTIGYGEPTSKNQDLISTIMESTETLTGIGTTFVLASTPSYIHIIENLRVTLAADTVVHSSSIIHVETTNLGGLRLPMMSSLSTGEIDRYIIEKSFKSRVGGSSTTITMPAVPGAHWHLSIWYRVQ